MYFCAVKLGAAWEALAGDWAEARIQVTLEEPERLERAAQLLAPLQPLVTGPNSLTFRVNGKSDTTKRLLERLDRERIHASLAVASSDPIAARPAEKLSLKLREQWEAALATLPSDWSDVLAEVELLSSDWLDRAALDMAPINPRRDGGRLALRFRAARRFGYGGSPQMVARCLERCDRDGIRGSVEILRVLSDTRPVQTQGPVWLLEGKTV